MSSRLDRVGGGIKLAVMLLILFSLPTFIMAGYGRSVSDQTHKVAKKKRAVRTHKMVKTQTTDVAPGQWGGTGISLTVGSDSSQIGYDCANGEITERLKIDRSGNFNAGGVFIRRTPGPEREDQPPARQPARYTGHVSGDNMTLKVTLTSDGTQIGEFQLERGKTGRLHRCY